MAGTPSGVMNHFHMSARQSPETNAETHVYRNSRKFSMMVTLRPR